MKVYKWINLSVALVMLVSFFVVSQPAQAQNSNGARPEGDYMPGELVVVYEPGVQALDYTALSRTLEADHGVRTMKVSPSGAALVAVDESRSLDEVKDELQADPSVELVEYNYIYSIPELSSHRPSEASKQFVLRGTPKGLEKDGVKAPLTAIPAEALKAMKSVRSGRVTATYPNDPYLWWNGGWDMVGANIVWPNTTASAAVCVLDTGVDYTHPDLSGRIIKGYDYVNGDADPMDDFGHGTHVAGIITAVHNNGKGMAGVSTAKVVAVKVLGSQGWGTSFDIAAGINECANRSDVKVLSLSLGGMYSNQIETAIAYAVTTKGKLVVAAAGNDDTDDTTYAYPAAFSTWFPNKVLAVAASGMWEDMGDSFYTDYFCKADYSNYGDWISVVAPGSDIYSTTPWDKPFYMNYFYDVATRYDYMSGTSMATPFVAAAAARRWGFKPLETNTEIATDLQDGDLSPNWVSGDDGSCWPAEMADSVIVNVAGQLERGSVEAEAFDSTTGIPLAGATTSVYMGTTQQSSAVIPTNTYKGDPYGPDPSRIYTSYQSWTDIINLPSEYGCTVKLNKSGYTNGNQLAYQHSDCGVYPGGYYWVGRAVVPPKSANIDAALGWYRWASEFGFAPDYWDLDLNVWLPEAPNPLDVGQPASFIVGPDGDDYGFYEGEPFGAMTAFPFARLKRDGGYQDSVPVEDTTISSRKAHAPLAANAALPYYAGAYNILVTDYGQTFNNDGDDGTTPEVPLLGYIAEPYLYIWKDGVIKLFSATGYQMAGDPCNDHNWWAASISSGKTGTPTFVPYSDCGDETYVPYVGANFDPANVKFSK